MKKSSKYESLHKTVIVSDLFNPGRVIRPIVVIIMVISVMCVYLHFQKKNIIANSEQMTNQMAEYIAGNIANEMDYAKSSIKFASAAISHSMTSDTLENPAEIISPLVVNTPFADIEYIRADGMNVMNIGEVFDASDRVYYKEGIKGNTGIWNNYHPKTSQETLMNFYTPILYQGEVTGVLTGYIAATTQISPLFESKLYGQNIYGLLVDENDMVICSTIDSEYVADLSLDALMESLGADEKERPRLRSAIDAATEEAVCYEDESGEGRICVTTIPETAWKVVILVPADSLNAIVSSNTRNSVFTIFVISLILISYATYVLMENIKRRRAIARENVKLEEENRNFNEENKRAFNEISAIRDINASANMGTWRTEMVEGESPRMYVDDTMRNLLGVEDEKETPEETYHNWFMRVVPEAVPSVIESFEKMKQGKFDENTYLWFHPVKGERYVRCGGTAQKIQGGYLFSGYHYDVDEVVREDMAKVAMLKDALNEKNDYYNTLGTLAGIYNSLYVIDLRDDTAVEFIAGDKDAGSPNHLTGAYEKIALFMAFLATDEYKKRAIAFADFRTLANRMKNKRFISSQLVGKKIGWFLATFITMETEETGRPVKVIFTTQSIDEEKKQEEKLILKSQTDELTGLLNRRAYEENIYKHNNIPKKGCFVLMSLDVNGLKAVNDTLGHAAGDELLIGAADCMKRCLGPYGSIYRTGGDEFMAILTCDSGKLKAVLADFEDTISKWKGEQVESLSISYGYISKEEEPNMSVRELGVIADQRMYEAKSEHYRKTGVDRMGNQEAHRVLLERYTKILKINISDDTYRIINMDETEKTAEEGFSDKASVWLSSFGTSGQVHPDDLEEYLKKTDFRYMKEYFAGNHGSLVIFYRRKYGEVFKPTMMEIVKADDYSEKDPNLYLYVKQIVNN